MNIAVNEIMESKVRSSMDVQYLQLFNESHMHAGPSTDSHFKLVLVSDGFNGMSKVKRHQFIYGVLKDELAGPVHALALHLYTPQEWDQTNVPDSPMCAGKNIKNK